MDAKGSEVIKFLVEIALFLPKNWLLDWFASGGKCGGNEPLAIDNIRKNGARPQNPSGCISLFPSKVHCFGLPLILKHTGRWLAGKSRCRCSKQWNESLDTPKLLAKVSIYMKFHPTIAETLQNLYRPTVSRSIQITDRSAVTMALSPNMSMYPWPDRCGTSWHYMVGGVQPADLGRKTIGFWPLVNLQGRWINMNQPKLIIQRFLHYSLGPIFLADIMWTILSVT